MLDIASFWKFNIVQGLKTKASERVGLQEGENWRSWLMLDPWASDLILLVESNSSSHKLEVLCLV